MERLTWMFARSGDEGHYPDLENVCESRIRNQFPESKILRQDKAVSTAADLDLDEWKNLEQELNDWSSSVKSQEQKISTRMEPETERLPPVRSSTVILNGVKENGHLEKPVKNTRAAPRDFKEWEKLDIDKALEDVDQPEDKAVTVVAQSTPLSEHVDLEGLSDKQRCLKANQEKDKGNESFRANDHEEAAIYYTRSLSFFNTTAGYNNRALIYLKLKKWDQALNDCNNVLKMETNNLKALLRRASAYQGKNMYAEAREDLEHVLHLEPGNIRAKDLLKEQVKEKAKTTAERKSKGTRIVIEETDGSESESEAEIQPPAKHLERPETDSHAQSAADALSSGDAEVNPSYSAEKRHRFTDMTSCEQKDHVVKHEQEIHRINPEPAERSPDDQELEAMLSTFNPTLRTEMSGDCSVDPEACKTKNVQSTSLSRPILIKHPLSPNVEKLHQKGNQLFTLGQYGGAMAVYTEAISKLNTNLPEQQVNLSVLYSNRAAACLKVGDCVSAIQDCRESLNLVAHSIKPLLRRGVAYEALERYGKAYVDFKHALSIDPALDAANLGASRCLRVLRDEDGVHWRAKLPPMVSASPWEIPLIKLPNEGDEALDPLSFNSTRTDRSVDSSTGNALPASYVSITKDSAAQSQRKTNNISNSHIKPDQQDHRVAGSAQINKDNEQQDHRVAGSTQINKDNELKGSKASVNENFTTPRSENRNIAAKESLPPTTGEQFETMKAEGNRFVKLGNFNEAVTWYTKCAKLLPKLTVSYTNRSLCYLRLKKPKDALNDCTVALGLDSSNIKAYFRRAQAKKMLEDYQGSVADLSALLKLDQKNDAAIREMTVVKNYWREQLEKIKSQAPAPKKESKLVKDSKQKMTRVVIEEAAEDGPASTGKNPTVLSNPDSSHTTSKLTKGQRKAAKQNDKSAAEVSKPVPVSLCVPSLTKATPYEFMQAWNSLKTSQEMGPFAEILKQIDPDNMKKMISNKLDGTMLTTILKTLGEHFIGHGEDNTGFRILKSLCQVSRFQTVAMFMSKKEKLGLQSVFQRLSDHQSCVYSPADVNELLEKYGIC